MVHTSTKIQGQVYIPAVNWSRASHILSASFLPRRLLTRGYIVLVGTIVMVAAFKNLAHLTNAYG